MFLLEGVGFEPTKKISPDLQSGAFNRSATLPQMNVCIKSNIQVGLYYITTSTNIKLNRIRFKYFGVGGLGGARIVREVFDRARLYLAFSI